MDIARRIAPLRARISPPGDSNVPAPRRNRRRNLVKFASLGCLIAGIGVTVWFFVRAGAFEEAADPAQGLKAGREAQVSTKESVIVAPVFTGFDNDRQPYLVSAKSARRDEDSPDVVFLDQVKGELKLRRSGDLMVMTADKGKYGSDSRNLDLEGNVRMISTGRYSAKADTVRVNMPEKRLRSETPVNVEFSSAVIDANGVELWDAGERMLFFNGVRLHIPRRTPRQDKQGFN